MDIQPDKSWLAGKWEAIDYRTDGNKRDSKGRYTKFEPTINDYKYVINTQLPYVSIGDYYAQGDDADQTIGEIYTMWISSNYTQVAAIKEWARSNGVE